MASVCKSSGNGMCQTAVRYYCCRRWVGERQNITMQRLAEAPTRHTATPKVNPAPGWLRTEEGCCALRGRPLAGQSQDFSLTFPAVQDPPLGKEMPTQLLSLSLLSGTTLHDLARQKWYQLPSVPPWCQGISPFTQKSYSSTGFHLSRQIPTRFRTQVTFLIPWKANSHIPAAGPKNPRKDYSSHQSLYLLRMHIVWTDWSKLKAAQLSANSS